MLVCPDVSVCLSVFVCAMCGFLRVSCFVFTVLLLACFFLSFFFFFFFFLLCTASRAASLVVVLEPVAKGAVIAGTPIDDNQWLDLTKCVVVWLCGCVVVWLCGCVFVCLCATHTHTHSLALAPHPPLLPLTLVLLSLLHRRARAALRRVLTREGVPVFSSLDQALPHVARMAKHNRPEQCQRQQQRQAERMPGATALPFQHQHETHIRANARGMTALIEVG